MSKDNLNFETTRDIQIPKDPFERIIGQEDAVKIARLIPKQRRHLLLVGPPGTGKSMIAQAIANVLPKPKYEIAVLHNQNAPERPLVEIRKEEDIAKEQNKRVRVGKNLMPHEVPTFVAERLGFRCKRCGSISDYGIAICPECGADKYLKQNSSYFEDNFYGLVAIQGEENLRVTTTRTTPDNKQERVIYERQQDGTINVLTQMDIKKLDELTKKAQRRIIVPLTRSTFIQASGASETELLGDVRHDPYGGHPQLGTPPYTRVIAGAVHEAHEGVLFIDELSTLGQIQKFILTAMQDKVFPIVGRNPTSSGAIVRVDTVPCDFILVGAVNINDINSLAPALRSRVRGDGYEVLMNAYMPDNFENRKKITQFITQEIAKDGKIPNATYSAVEEMIGQTRRIAKIADNAAGLTLRLRNLGGIIKLAGDIAVSENSELIDRNHVKLAIKNSKSIEEQIRDKYDSWWKAEGADYGFSTPKPGVETG